MRQHTVNHIAKFDLGKVKNIVGTGENASSLVFIGQNDIGNNADNTFFTSGMIFSKLFLILISEIM